MKPWQNEEWVIPPEQDARFVWKMEDVLEVYQRPYDPKRPMICMDETSRQLIKEVRQPLRPDKRQAARHDYEYERNGVVNLFMFFEPLGGRREVMIRERRTKIDWAWCIKRLLNEHYPDAEKVVLVMDNLNTHTPASLYEAFSAKEARRLLQRLEIHYTPEHGSWLNMAEIELAALATQGLAQRIGETSVLRSEVAAWTESRNAAEVTADWQFATGDARTKLKRLYPTIDD